MTAPPPPTPPSYDPYFALRHRDFRFFLAARLLASMGVLMQDVAVGWQLYERTHSALALGLTGLVSVTPTILFALPAGAVADRYDRRNVVRMGRVLAGAMSVWLAVLSATQGPVWMIYVALFLGGVGFAFLGPAQSALLTQVLPVEAYSNGVTWNSTTFQIASVTGPALGGALIALTGSATIVYVVCAVMAAAYLVLLTIIRPREHARDLQPVTRQMLAAGIRFVFQDQLILAAITLDLFAVLFGGATTLLPIYAKDILRVGPSGLGCDARAGQCGEWDLYRLIERAWRVRVGSGCGVDRAGRDGGAWRDWDDGGGAGGWCQMAGVTGDARARRRYVSAHRHPFPSDAIRARYDDPRSGERGSPFGDLPYIVPE